jgi:hypothetical protein
MSVNIIQIDDGDNTAKTEAQYLVDLQDKYRHEDNEGRTFVLAAKASVYRAKIWRLMEKANGSNEDLLKELASIHSDLCIDLRWPISVDVFFRKELNDTLVTAMYNHHRKIDEPETDLVWSLIEELEEICES